MLRRAANVKSRSNSQVAASRTVADDPTEAIRDAIVAGRFFPNERLIEEDLVRDFGAKRTAVRAALTRLAHEGLVVHEPNRGARVRVIAPDEAVGIMEARAMLETLVVRHAALKISTVEIRELRAIVREIERRYKAGDLLGCSAVNATLHAAIVRIAGHPVAAKLLRSLRAQSVAFQFRPILEPGRAAAMVREHRELMRALAARDPDAAERVMRRHLQAAVSALQSAIARERTSALP
jgi:DNA-binding GntR family transcriptional regulator